MYTRVESCFDKPTRLNCNSFTDSGPEMFQKFMNKKFFHPGSYQNIQRVWEAEKKAAEREKRERELSELQAREQDNLENRILLTNDDRLKQGLGFMYNEPPGLRKPMKEDKASSSSLPTPTNQTTAVTPMNDADLPPNPDTTLKKVRCYRCGRWGHVNTDRDCPMYTLDKRKNIDHSSFVDAGTLITDMETDSGLTMRRNVVTSEFDRSVDLADFVVSDGDDEQTDKFINSLTRKQQKRLLKQLATSPLKQAKKERKLKGKKSTKHDRRSPDLDDPGLKHGAGRKRKLSCTPSGQSRSKKRPHSSRTKSEDCGKSQGDRHADTSSDSWSSVDSLAGSPRSLGVQDWKLAESRSARHSRPSPEPTRIRRTQRADSRERSRGSKRSKRSPHSWDKRTHSRRT